MLLLVSGLRAFSLPVNGDLAAWRPEKFECAQDIFLSCPYFGTHSKFLIRLDRPIGQVQDVFGIANLQAVINLQLMPWNVQRSDSRADVNSILSRRLTEKLIAPVIGSIKMQAGGGLQPDGTVFVRLRNILKHDKLLNADLNASDGMAKTILFREGRLGIVRPLDANILLSTTLIGEVRQDSRPAAGGKSQKIVEQSMGYKYLASESLRLTVGRQLGGAWFDTAASVREIQLTNVVKIGNQGHSVGSNLYRLRIDGRRGRWFTLERPAVSQEPPEKSLLPKSDAATLSHSDSISVLVDHILNLVVFTTSTDHSSVYPTESRQSRALFLSRLKMNAAATGGMSTNSLALP